MYDINIDELEDDTKIVGKYKKVDLGDIYETRTGSMAEVVYYENAKSVWVQFLDEVGYIRAFEARDLRRKGFKNPFQPTIYGKGFIGVGVYSAGGDGNTGQKPAYKCWFQMMRRCYDEEYHKKNNSYIGCFVEDYFLNFQNFGKWYHEHPKFIEEYHLDKDVLFRGNKEYSRKNCCFVPREINNLFHANTGKRGIYPIGVTKKSGGNRFIARCSVNSKNVILGNFDNPEDAHRAYILAKEENVRTVANKYQSTIDTRLYKMLSNWEYEGDEKCL